jgi:flavin-dependent dehydrogenase
VRATRGAGWALVGDAALQQDPWTGRGMEMASIHATFLADAVVDRLGGRATEDEALGRYQQLRDDHALVPFEETVTFARDLSSLGAESAPP